MRPACCSHRGPIRVAFAVTAAVLSLTGCGTVPTMGDLSDDGDVTREGGAMTMTIEAPFEDVWPAMVELVEERGYPQIDREQGERDETHRIKGEQEDRTRDKVFRETVTERHGRIVATTADGGVVALELKEQYEWEMSVVDQLAAASGSDERYRLGYQGVEITAGDTNDQILDRAEFGEVFDAIQARFE